MNIKFTRVQLFWTGILLFFIVTVLGSLSTSIHFPLDTIYQEKSYGFFNNEAGEIRYGSLHLVFQWFFWIMLPISFIVFLYGILDSDSEIFNKILKEKQTMSRTPTTPTTPSFLSTLNYKKYFKWGIILLILTLLFNFGRKQSSNMVNMYNQSVSYQNDYTQTVQEKKGYYDKMWKSYIQKEKIANISTEIGIKITKIIMNNVSDGKNLSWKWVSKYPEIPYSEFTKFYTDLSDFVITQREGYFNLDKKCQTIANENNTLLDTFPNNLYNKVLNRQKINFEYSFTSDSTETVFSTKKENIKK